MEKLEQILYKAGTNTLYLLKGNASQKDYTKLDLSVNNKRISDVDLSDPILCQRYIDRILWENSAKVAYGGYLEERNLYKGQVAIKEEMGMERNIHLGMDFWSEKGTEVLVPLDGKVHSFKNNNVSGDYGPTIILQHTIDEVVFYTLYGHLSLESLEDLYINKPFGQGDVLGSLGDSSINVNYAPHLHFQIIANIGNNTGDYPGVCSKAEVVDYAKNCPNPNILLKMEE